MPSKWSGLVLRANMEGDVDPRVDEEVLRRTEEEVADGKAAGPYTE